MTLRKSRTCARRSQTPRQHSLLDGPKRHAKPLSDLRLSQPAIEQALHLVARQLFVAPATRTLTAQPATFQVRTNALRGGAERMGYLRSRFAPVNGGQNILMVRLENGCSAHRSMYLWWVVRESWP